MISIVICTRNRAGLLARSLRNLAAIDHSWLSGWEVVVVDNGSLDDTREVLDTFSMSLPLRYVQEKAQGLSRARNRGITAARKDIIAFTDDDCLVTSNWAEKIIRAFERDPTLSIVGGRALLADADDAAVGVRFQRENARVTRASQILELMIGCNVAFRRSVFEIVGMFDTSLGAGTPAGSAEDIDLLYRALKRGLKIAYLAEIIVLHAHGRKMPVSLQTEQYIRGRGAFYCKHIADREILKLAYWEVRHLLGQGLSRNFRPSVTLLRSLAAGAALRLFQREN